MEDYEIYDQFQEALKEKVKAEIEAHFIMTSAAKAFVENIVDYILNTFEDMSGEDFDECLGQTLDEIENIDFKHDLAFPNKTESEKMIVKLLNEERDAVLAATNDHNVSTNADDCVYAYFISYIWSPIVRFISEYYPE